jgi:glycerate kinase
LLAIGGSATNDGGAGMAQALGIGFLDKEGKQIDRGCEGIVRLDHLNLDQAHPLLKHAEITIACDVQNRLCGPEGASRVFGPQKGANDKTVHEMDLLLNHLAQKIVKHNGVEVRCIGGLGAAGGIAVPLVAFFGAKIVSGIYTILELIGFEKHIQNADYIFTGEGRIDVQTQYGKTIAGILKMAKKTSVPVIAFCGSLGEGYEGILQAGVRSCFSILPGVVSLQQAMKEAKVYLEDCAKRVACLLP